MLGASLAPVLAATVQLGPRGAVQLVAYLYWQEAARPSPKFRTPWPDEEATNYATDPMQACQRPRPPRVGVKQHASQACKFANCTCTACSEQPSRAQHGLEDVRRCTSCCLHDALRRSPGALCETGQFAVVARRPATRLPREMCSERGKPAQVQHAQALRPRRSLADRHHSARAGCAAQSRSMQRHSLLNSRAHASI